MVRKRTNGEGSVRRTPSGTWRGQLMDGYREDGKRNIVNFTGATKGEVLDQMRQFKHQRETLGSVVSKQTTFANWADIWYADYKSQVQPSTYENYRYTLKLLKDYFGGKKLREIKVLDINRFHDHLRQKGLSQSYLTKCRSMLIQIFDAAEANEEVSSNPARKSKSIRVQETAGASMERESKKDAFSDVEQEFLEKGLKDDLIGHSILLMLGSGMRTQELLALKCDDIREDGSAITVTKAVKMVGGVPAIGAPKSNRGRRVIPVAEKYRQHAVYLRENGGREYIWTSGRESGVFDVGAFRKRYYRTIGKIPGVRRLSPHCCRHTYISNLEKKGVPMELIARLAGHSRITTTDGYLHTNFETLTKAVSVLNEN